MQKRAMPAHISMKPYRDREILATIELALSCKKYRYKGKKFFVEDIVSFNENYTFDTKRQILKKDEVQILLTPLQIKLVCILVSNPNIALSSGYLCEAIWQQRCANTLRSLVHRTNKTIGCEFIKNISGVGYMILSK